MLALGTVELGMAYGFRGGSRYTQPDAAAAVRLIHRGLDLGINLLDTAPSYGESETIVGTALRGVKDRPFIATKVTVPEENPGPGIRDSIESSLRALGTETLDLLQIHNATMRVLQNEEALREIENAVAAGKVRFAGASIYEIDEGRQALAWPSLSALQVAFNVLDRSMELEVIPKSQAAGVGVLVRSAFLRGVLTGDSSDIPPKLQPLRDAAAQALAIAGENVSGCAELALRFCLSIPGISSVLAGVRSIEELEANVTAAERGPLAPKIVDQLCNLNVADEKLLNPRNWAELI